MDSEKSKSSWSS